MSRRKFERFMTKWGGSGGGGERGEGGLCSLDFVARACQKATS